MPCQQGRSTGAQNGGRLSVLRQFFCLKQFKKRLFIVLYEIPDIRSALLDDGVPLGFQLHFLRFRASVERWKLAQAQMDTKIPAVMGSVKSA